MQIYTNTFTLLNTKAKNYILGEGWLGAGTSGGRKMVDTVLESPTHGV